MSKFLFEAVAFGIRISQECAQAIFTDADRMDMQLRKTGFGMGRDVAVLLQFDDNQPGQRLFFAGREVTEGEAGIYRQPFCFLSVHQRDAVE